MLIVLFFFVHILMVVFVGAINGDPVDDNRLVLTLPLGERG